MSKSIEIVHLTYITLFTAVCWVPYVLNLIAVRGLMNAVGYPDDPKPLAPWAQRMKNAHANAVENLVVFAPLVLAVYVLDASNETTATATAVYLYARLAHYVVYTAKIPWARTLTFAAGAVCQVVLATRVLEAAWS